MHLRKMCLNTIKPNIRVCPLLPKTHVKTQCKCPNNQTSSHLQAKRNHQRVANILHMRLLNKKRLSRSKYELKDKKSWYTLNNAIIKTIVPHRYSNTILFQIWRYSASTTKDSEMKRGILQPPLSKMKEEYT